MKIVVDTNIVISGIFFDGKPEKVLQLCMNSKFADCVSAEIVDEYKRVIDEMQKKTTQKVPTEALDSFLAKTQLVTPDVQIDACRDPDDNKFIECAESARATFIVSGDKDLLDLKQYNNIKIATASEFLEDRSQD